MEEVGEEEENEDDDGRLPRSTVSKLTLHIPMISFFRKFILHTSTQRGPDQKDWSSV